METTLQIGKINEHYTEIDTEAQAVALSLIGAKPLTDPPTPYQQCLIDHAGQCGTCSNPGGVFTPCA